MRALFAAGSCGAIHRALLHTDSGSKLQMSLCHETPRGNLTSQRLPRKQPTASRISPESGWPMPICLWRALNLSRVK